jgi:signal transduction histidine kinase
MSAMKRKDAPFLKGLSARLLALTIAFVMLAEVLIYAPSVARYRKTYLEEHIEKAHLATLALEAMPNRIVDADLRRKLLAYSGTHNIRLRLTGRSVFALGEAKPPMVDASFDLRETGFFGWIRDAFETLVQDGNRVLHVKGPSPNDASVVVEITLDETPMQREMFGYSGRILWLSIVISAVTAGLLYLCLQWLMVGPMRRITESMTRFRADPEREVPEAPPGVRSDEIGVAQRELAAMQQELSQALQQKERLAALGSAVAKINHDLRNSLATAVLASDRLATSDDPTVKQDVPRLFNAIDRAVNLCTQTLKFVSDAGPKPVKTQFSLAQLIAEVGTGITDAEPGANAIQWENTVAPAVMVEADREQLYRALSNVGRNAFQSGARRVALSAFARNGRLCIDVADDGPGLAEEARGHLFEPFAGSARKGGTGLGLVIVRDVMRAHGGDIDLLETGAGGTTFRLDLPLPAQGGNQGSGG